MKKTTIEVKFIILVFLVIMSCVPSKEKMRTDNASPSETVLASDKTIDDHSDENGIDLLNKQAENINPISVKKYSSTWRDVVADIGFLAEMHNLGEVNIRGNNLLTDITTLSALTKLKRLTLSYTPNIQSIEPLSNLINLEYLLLNYEKPSDCAELKNLKDLKELHLGGTYVTSLFYISSLTELEHLTLFIDNKNIDTHRLERLVNLKYLHLAGDGNRIDLTALSGLKNLEEIHLNHFIDLDLQSLQSLPRLKCINFHNSTVSISIMSLLDNRAIETLGIPSNFGELPKIFHDKLNATNIRCIVEDDR
jgi:hypothetical protein